MTASTWTTLLRGIVGSHAYGLATPESDVDRLEFAVMPTADLFGLSGTHEPKSRVSHDPDITVHEIGKALGLLLKCNPTVTELLWLNDHEMTTRLGLELVMHRNRFLSAPYVRDAYLGYAAAQFRKLQHEREDADNLIENRRHLAKNARHLRRLLDQGVQLYTTGQLTVPVADREALFDFGRRAAEDPSLAIPYLTKAKDIIDRTTSPLPQTPDRDFAEMWLRDVREHYFLLAHEMERGMT